MAIAGIVAGGTGSRMGSDIPKQFLDLDGKPVIIHTIEAFLKHEKIRMVIVGVNPEWTDHMRGLAEQYFNGGVYITPGGADRNGTIMNIISYAKESLSCSDDEIILTHDAVRPFVTKKMIDDSIAAMDSCDICTAAVAATDTMAVSENGVFVSDFPVRSTMFRVQTPQTFRTGDFIGMLDSVSIDDREKITDACKLFHMNGKKVRLIEGSERNIKLTFPSDFEAARSFMKAMQSVDTCN